MKSSPLKNALETGTVAGVVAITGRMADLPEFGRMAELERVRMLAAEAEEYELLAASRREAMRKAALRLLNQVKENWTAEEIETATGYTP